MASVQLSSSPGISPGSGKFSKRTSLLSPVSSAIAAELAELGEESSTGIEGNSESESGSSSNQSLMKKK